MKGDTNWLSFGALLRDLREQVGCTQRDLERRGGLPRGRVSKLEQGSLVLSRSELERLTGVLGYEQPEFVVERGLCSRHLFPGVSTSGERELGKPEPFELRWIEAGAGAVVVEVDRRIRAQASVTLVEKRWQRERQQAGHCWERLRSAPADRQRLLVELVGSYQTWAVCERLCEESVRAAAHDARQALTLADLAVLVAERSQGGEGRRKSLRAYAWAFVGNSWRVAGDLWQAEVAFQRSGLVLEEDIRSTKPLDATRPLVLLAVLRSVQGRFEEALGLLERAINYLRPDPAPLQEARILHTRAMVLEARGCFAEAQSLLERVIPIADRAGYPRLQLAILFNSVSLLCNMGRFAEAERDLHGVRRIAFDLGRGLDLLRVRWLEARVAEGLGHLDQAAHELDYVWREFATRGVAFDAALAALSLAALQLGRGKTREVRSLAAMAAPIFASQNLPAEQISALNLFWQGAAQEMATAEAARHLLEAIRRVKNGLPP